jgi:O-antigen/teichoic acid export membrane protein
LLARFVTPDVLGTMGIVTQLNQALYMFSDVGIGTSIVNHKKGDDLTFLRTAWTVQIIRSFVITALGMLLSYPFALLFADETHPPDMLFWVTLATTGAMLINGFQSVSFFLGTRELRVARTLFMDLIAQTIGTAVSVALAWHLRNVWALVIGNLLTTLLRTLLSFVMLQKVPLRLCWDEEARKDLLGFGKWIMVSTILTFFANAMDRFLLAKLLGLTAFGLYNTALMFAMVPIELMLRITVGVLVPVYAKKKDDQNRLSAEVFDRVGFVMLLVSGCLIAGVAATAPGFVRAIYKPDFHAAAAMVPWLAGAAWLRVLHNNAVAAMLAMGRAKSSALGNGLKLDGARGVLPDEGRGEHHAGRDRCVRGARAGGGTQVRRVYGGRLAGGAQALEGGCARLDPVCGRDGLGAWLAMVAASTGRGACRGSTYVWGGGDRGVPARAV